jgi:hypothetical protein
MILFNSATALSLSKFMSFSRVLQEIQDEFFQPTFARHRLAALLFVASSFKKAAVLQSCSP